MFALLLARFGALGLTIHLLGQVPPVPSKTESGESKQPRLVVRQRSTDLGTVLEGDKAPVQWMLENQGNADLVIENTRASCGCTVVKLTEAEKTIPPGGKLELKADFDSTGRRGRQMKSIAVSSNDPAQPTISVEFTAEVDALYEMRPTGALNLRAVRRGESAERTLDIFPGGSRKAVKIHSIETAPDSPVTFQTELFQDGERTGQRIRAAMRDDLPLGTVIAEATIKLEVDGVVKERVVSIRGEVVGDLIWQPQLVDVTRQSSAPGLRLPAVSVRASGQTPFEIGGVEAGPLLTAKVEETPNAPKGTQYSVVLALRDDAPAGPFAATAEIRTSSLDQPVIRVPIFGIVAAPVDVDPPVVLLRQDGTPIGAKRRVKLQASPQTQLALIEVRCGLEGVRVAPVEDSSRSRPHIRLLELSLTREFAEGVHRGVVIVSTSVAAAREIQIPVTVVVPKRG